MFVCVVVVCVCVCCAMWCGGERIVVFCVQSACIHAHNVHAVRHIKIKNKKKKKGAFARFANNSFLVNFFFLVYH